MRPGTQQIIHPTFKSAPSFKPTMSKKSGVVSKQHPKLVGNIVVEPPPQNRFTHPQYKVPITNIGLVKNIYIASRARSWAANA